MSERSRGWHRGVFSPVSVMFAAPHLILRLLLVQDWVTVKLLNRPLVTSVDIFLDAGLFTLIQRLTSMYRDGIYSC